MKQIYWDIIEQSKQGCNFNSEKQYKNLFELLKDKNERFIRDFQDEWGKDLGKCIRENIDDLSKIHVKNHLWEGSPYGILEGYDNDFEWFCDWFFAQGKELWDLYNKNGYKVIIDYIKTNDISDSNYTYESMYYVFDELANYKGYEFLEQTI